MATTVLERNDAFKEVESWSALGTENYYRHPLMRRFFYTDGIKQFAKQFSAYWYIDFVASYIPEITRKDKQEDDIICFPTIEVKNGRAYTYFARDKGEDKYLTKRFKTDLADGLYEFYLSVADEDYNYILCLIPER